MTASQSQAFDQLKLPGQLRRIRTLARNALERFGLHPDSALVQVNHTENTTFRVDDPASSERYALRVHRDGYHSLAAIESELAWLAALRGEASLPTPEAVPGRDGRLVQTVSAPGVPTDRRCVLFRWMHGRFPGETRLRAPYRRLGEVAARLHTHSRAWRKPDGFTRLRWDLDETIGDRPNWGNFSEAPGLKPDESRLLSELAEVLRIRLQDYGRSADRFGLIHADLRLANILIHRGETRVIDFDDCGYGWYLYDLATALWTLEERPDFEELIAVWLQGYRQVLPIGAADEAEIMTFCMLRRLTVIGWIASHFETDLARELGPEQIASTCRLARDYLARA